MSGREQDTELRIKEAARKVFLEKGFTAAKTRDIAEAANINLALLNYYFRTKKKLFDIIMTETLQSFFAGVKQILNEENTSIKEKITQFVEHYIALLSENQNVAPFILNAVRENPSEYVSKIGMHKSIKNSVFIKQFEQAKAAGEIAAIHPIHFLLNLMGLVVFPFMAQPIISAVSGIPKAGFLEIIQERKRLIPLWLESMLSVQ